MTCQAGGYVDSLRFNPLINNTIFRDRCSKSKLNSCIISIRISHFSKDKNDILYLKLELREQFQFQM